MPVLQMPGPNVDQLLRTAIEQKRLIQFVYRNKERIVEPHDYGIHNGRAKLLAYQVGGASSERIPNWRWIETDSISNFHVRNETFPGGRRAPSGKHHKWDKLFIRVKPAPES